MLNYAESNNTITIFTDGACRGNPGPGGYGIIIKVGRNETELSGGFRLTTNNRMEIMPVIIALERLKNPSDVVVYSDSQYLVNAMSEGWAKRWQKNNWMRNKKDKALNPDIWQRLLQLCEYHRVDFRWIKGHSAHKENERCDALSVAAATRKDLPADSGYDGKVTENSKLRLI